MTEQAASQTKLPKGRSPNYPGISLETAIDRARTLYDYGELHPIPLKTIMEKWGYKSPTSGHATVTYASLKKFGLLEDDGRGDQKLGHVSDLAVEILHPNPRQQAAVKDAALHPPIIREWWQRYNGNLPPDETLRWEYVVQGPFTESGLRDFLRVYRETIA